MRTPMFFAVAALAACATESIDETPPAPVKESVAASASGLTWNPHGPFSKPQLEQLCNDPEVDELSPPPQGGFCSVEIRLVRTSFTSGQGATEGRGEISFEASADPLNTPPGDATVGSGAESTYNVDQTSGHNIDLGTYRVPVGQTRDVEICVDFTEHDDGGVNGQDDTASTCRTVQLRCVGADLNGDGVPDGQAAMSTTMGATLCGDNVCNGSVSAEIQVMAADADMDNIPNDQDFTPEMCDEERKATAGNAALVYYHYGDTGLINLAQSLGLNINQVFAEYDYVVLVADNDASNPTNVNAAMFANADATFPPTLDGLVDGMRDLTSRGYRFDTFVFSHGFKDGADDSEFEVISGDRISGDRLLAATAPDVIGTALKGVPIMAWWSTTCIAARQIDAWITLGAKSVSGSKDVYFYPNTWGPFFANWVGGDPYRDAVDDSLTFTVVAAAELAIRQEGKLPPYLCLKDDPLTPIPGDGPGVVTDENDCAEDFFSDAVGNFTAYNIEEVYDSSLSGADNMAASSVREFLGNGSLTFGAAGQSWP